MAEDVRLLRKLILPIADLKLLRRLAFLSSDATLRIECRCKLANGSLYPGPTRPVLPSLEQNEVGRVDSEASDRVLPVLMRSEESATSDSEETISSSTDGTGEDGSWDGVTEPHTEFRSVDDPEDRTGEERSTIPEAIEAASGAEAAISGTFRPSC